MDDVPHTRVHAAKMKAARNAIGLPQEEAARQIGVSRVTVQNWESGRRRRLTLERLRRVAEVYEVPAGDLIDDGTLPPTPPPPRRLRKVPSYGRNFGPNLDRAIEEAGITAYKLAEQVGIDEAKISSFRRGEATPGLDTAKHIAVVLGKPLDSMLRPPLEAATPGEAEELAPLEPDAAPKRRPAARRSARRRREAG